MAAKNTGYFIQPEKRQVSMDNGSTWVDTGETRNTKAYNTALCPLTVNGNLLVRDYRNEEAGGNLGLDESLYTINVYNLTTGSSTPIVIHAGLILFNFGAVGTRWKFDRPKWNGSTDYTQWIGYGSFDPTTLIPLSGVQGLDIVSFDSHSFLECVVTGTVQNIRLLVTTGLNT